MIDHKKVNKAELPENSQEEQEVIKAEVSDESLESALIR